jgi:hypothetical protein
MKYRINKFITGIKNLWKWKKVIYQDRDWDYWFIYQILKTKLKFQEEHIRKYGYHENSEKYADQIKKVILQIEIVQNQKHIDDMIDSENIDSWSDSLFKMACEKHNEERKDLFKNIEENIEYWWE